jgi:ABC-2 type transport system permease protein
MNSPSNAVPQSSRDSQAIARTAAAATRPLYWSVRRELWEYRSIYIAPLIVAGLILLGMLISAFFLPRRLHDLSALDPVHQQEMMIAPYGVATGAIMLAAFVVGIFYCLDALYGERRDRSILFWKSLPVSDWTTVLAKASIPFVILPIVAFAIMIVTHLLMLPLSAAMLMRYSISFRVLWTNLPLFQMWLMLLYHLVTVHMLWYAPIYGWMLLVSAWARRSTFLWALIPPVAICIVEKFAFNTMHFWQLLKYRLSGPQAFRFPMIGDMPMDPMMHLELGKFLSTPGLWTGFVLTAVFLVAAVRLRRYRDPI